MMLRAFGQKIPYRGWLCSRKNTLSVASQRISTTCGISGVVREKLVCAPAGPEERIRDSEISQGSMTFEKSGRTVHLRDCAVHGDYGRSESCENNLLKSMPNLSEDYFAKKI